MSISDVIHQDITRATKVPKRAGFGVPGFFCFHTLSPDLAVELQDEEDVLDLGGTIYHPAYKAAARCFSQEPRPEKMLLIQRGTFTQLVHIIPLNLTEGYVYRFNFVDRAGLVTAISYTVLAGASTATVGTAIAALIDPLVDVTAAQVSTTHVLLTGVAGKIFQLTGLPSPSDLSVYVATVAGTLAADVSTFLASLYAGDAYAYTFDHCGEASQAAVAAVVEANRKMAFYDTSDTECTASGDTDDIGSTMKALSYARSVAFYLANETNGLQAVGLVGRCLPFDPGTETWAHKNIKGIVADDLLSGQESTLKTKRIMAYLPVTEDTPATLWGNVPDGDYIDTIRGVDMLFARIGEAIYTGFYANSKITLDDDGITIVEGLLRGVLDDNISSSKKPKLLASYEVDVPAEDDLETADKAARTLRGLVWRAKLAGAIHEVYISGTVGL